MQTYIKTAVWVIAGLSTMLTACGGGKKSESDPRAQVQTVDVATPVVQNITLSNVYPGQLKPISTVNVVARVSGQLTGKRYDIGKDVQQGAVLFTIDPSKYNDALIQAKGSLTTALSTRDYARSHYDAVKKALESDAVSKLDVIQAESALRQAEASVREAQAAVSTAQRNLGYCTVTAPISGKISVNNFSKGSFIDGEISPVTLATIYDTSTLFAQFAIEDKVYLDIINSKHDHASLDFDHVPVSFSEPVPHTYTGKVSYVAPTLNASTGTLEFNCDVDNSYGELRPGMYVKVKLPYGKLENAVLVKDAAISTDQLGKYLYTLNDSNKVVYTPIKVGPLYEDSLRVVTSELPTNVRYLTKALLKVRPGMTVDPRQVK